MKLVNGDEREKGWLTRDRGWIWLAIMLVILFGIVLLVFGQDGPA